jgi:small subunit ribosomal protein S3
VTQVTQIGKYSYRSFQKNTQVQIFIHQVSYPDEDATCLACFIVIALEQRVPFRRVLRNVEERVKSLKRVQGFRLQVSGRLNGSEIARIEWIRRGQVSLHQLFSNLDFSYKVAHTTYGSIGVKVWLSVDV